MREEAQSQEGRRQTEGQAMRIPIRLKPVLTPLLNLTVLLVAPAGAPAAPAEYGVSSFQMSACGDASAAGYPFDETGFLPCGSHYTQAGGTPYGLTTTVALNKEVVPNGNTVPVEDPKDFKVELPPGLVVNPQATPRCPIAVFNERGTHCPASTQVGIVEINQYTNSEIDPVFNVVPLEGRPATLGFGTSFNHNFVISGGVLSGEGYRLTAITSGIPVNGNVGFSITLWGVPADPAHDPQRLLQCIWFSEG